MNPFDLTGKTVLVTGGTRGLGRSIAFELAESGATIYAGYFQNEAAAEAFRAEAKERRLDAFTVRANLMTGSGIETYVNTIRDKANRLDCLVYNAATGVHRPLTELSQSRPKTTPNDVSRGAYRSDFIGRRATRCRSIRGGRQF